MKIIEPSVENITPIKYNKESIYKHIELCGRICYKSQDKITEDSYKKFCDNIKNNKHLSVFEHGTVYLFIKVNPYEVPSGLYNSWLTKCPIIDKYIQNPYSKVVDAGLDDNKNSDGSYHDLIGMNANGETQYCITTNMRVIIENGWEEDLKYLCEPTEYHEKRYTFRIVCGIDISREWNRHRKMSISEQSTRYCNYSKEKFGGEISYIRPDWLNKKYVDWFISDYGSAGEYAYDYTEEETEASAAAVLFTALHDAEKHYFDLLKRGVKPQFARKVLPLNTATEVIYTAFESDWEHFLSLRSSKAGATGQHLDINVLANQVYDFIYN